MEHSRVYVDVIAGDSQVLFTIKNVSENPLNIKGDELTERFVRGDVARTTEGSWHFPGRMAGGIHNRRIHN